MQGGDRKLAMLHIKKQFESSYSLTQSLRNAKETCPSVSDSKMGISSIGGYASKDPKTLHLKEDSTKRDYTFLTSFHTSHQKWPSRLRCSIPTVLFWLLSIPKWRGLHLNITSTRRRPSQSSRKTIIKMESRSNHRSSLSQCNFNASRSQPVISRQCRRC